MAESLREILSSFQSIVICLRTHSSYSTVRTTPERPPYILVFLSMTVYFTINEKQLACHKKQTGIICIKVGLLCRDERQRISKRRKEVQRFDVWVGKYDLLEAAGITTVKGGMIDRCYLPLTGIHACMYFIKVRPAIENHGGTNTYGCHTHFKRGNRNGNQG